MRILHFILGKANPNRANGVNQVIYGLVKYQRRAGHEVRVIGISRSMDVSYAKIQRDCFEVECFKDFNVKSFSYIKEVIENVDIVHMHGVWNKKNVNLGRYLENIKKPYVITAHCGYAMDRLKQSNYLFKLLFHHLWQKRLYEHASGIHALTREESTDISKFCKSNNIFVVPNGVDPEVYDKYQYQVHQGRKKIKLGYLGRISVEKNIDNLIRAIALLPEAIREKVELTLIGPISQNVARLKTLARDLGVEENLNLVGGKYAEEKIEALLDLDVYIHPAYSDVVGIAVMEAFALGLPVIVTRTSHMSYFYQSNAYIMVEPSAQDLCRGISEMLERRSEWQEFSFRAKDIYHKIFNWESVVDQLINEYQKII